MARLLVLAGCALVTACAGPAGQLPRTGGPASQPIPEGTSPRSGLDLNGFDRAVRPQDDLFRFTAGTWLANTEIPADRSTYGTFEVLDAQAEENLLRILQDFASRSDRATGTDEQKLGDFFTSFMDTARLNSAGITPLSAEIARIDAIRTPDDVARYIGYSRRIGTGHPLRYFVAQDARNSSVYLQRVSQSGLTMPDRDYYLKTDEKNQKLRAGLERYVSDLLRFAGRPGHDSAAKQIVALETRIAEAHWTRVRNRDPVATYNKVTIHDAVRVAPGFNWEAFLDGAGAPQGDINISQPSYVEALGKLVNTVPAEQWREYFTFRLIDEYAPVLTEALATRHFEFHQRELRGVQEQKPRWKRAVQTMNDLVGELVGRAYVARHFSPQSREHVRQIVDNLLKAFGQSLETLEWMSPATREEARRKLAGFTVKVGYPDQWRDYTALQISSTDLVGNVMRAITLEHERDIARLGGPIDRTEWRMPPQRVNAYYNPTMNEIVFPAAILQPPFFDPKADDAVNYGAIGSVIGHEISHGFDDSGRQYDGAGNLRDWWQPADSERFRERAGRLVHQYASFTVLDGQRINGELTLGENIGDLSGMTVAYRAYMLSLNGREPPLIDGFTGPQRFFFGWAQIWRRKYRDEELRMRLLTDPHSPAEFRVNGIVANMPEFHQAFDVREGDRLYRPAGERVKIW